MPPAVIEELLYSCMLVEPERRTARLEELCTSHPEHASALRDRFARLVRMGLVTLGADSGPAHATPRALPEQLGPFRIHGVLGRGGMGIVYSGSQPNLGDRPVAIKALLPERIADPVSEARFVREGLLAARLQHPNLCPVLDVGKDQGVVYLAMPLIEGEPLASKIEQWRANGRRPDWREVVRLVEKLARALHEAHGKGLVHRDVKPGNVIVRPDGEPVLLDFGLARDVVDKDDHLTRSRDVLGTLAYMAPEQADPHGRTADARTDVHALAATLFECLTSRLPRQAARRADMLRRIATEPATPLRRHVSGLPRDLEVAVAVALDTDPERRYATAEAFAEDLARILRNEPIVARPPGFLARGLRWTLRNRVATALIVTLAAGLAGTSVLSALLRDKNTESIVGERIARFEASRSKRRTDDTFAVALQARDLEPTTPRTLAPLLEVLGDTRVATVFELPSALSGIAVSADGRWLAAAAGDATLVQSVDEPDRRPLRLEGTRPRHLVWLADGEMITRTIDGEVRRVAPDGSIRWQQRVGVGVPAMASQIEPGLAIGKVGALDVVFAGTCDGAIVLLDLVSGEPAANGRIAVADGPVFRIAPVPNRDLVLAAVASRPRQSSVFLVATDGTRCEPRERMLSIVSTLLVDRNGCYVAHSGAPRDFRFGRVAGEPPVALALTQLLSEKGRENVRDVALDRGRLAIAAVDEVYVFDLDRLIAHAQQSAQDGKGGEREGGDAPVDDMTLREKRLHHQGGVSSVAFDPDGRTLLTSRSDGIAARWDIERERLIEDLLQAQATELTRVAAAPGRRVLVQGVDGKVNVLEPPQAPFHRVQLRTGLAQLVACWDAAGRVIVSMVGMAKLLTIDPTSGETTGEVFVDDDGVLDEPEREWTARLVVGAVAEPVVWGVRKKDSGTFYAVDPATGIADPPVELPKSRANLTAGASATADARTLALLRVSQGDSERVANVCVLRRPAGADRWQLDRSFELPAIEVRKLCWLNDTHLVLAGSDGAIRVADLESTRTLWPGREVGATFVAASSTSERVLAGFDDGGLFSIDARTGAATRWEGHGAAVASCAFAMDGRLAATADATGELALWDAASGYLLCRWQAHRARIEQVVFSPDGARIVTGSRDGTIAIWPTDLSIVDRIARERAPRVVRIDDARR
ncbi:MAG: protein kinase [Burkholderiales bacterium]|nr:protein kinase [Burkholderiales bacterium]